MRIKKERRQCWGLCFPYKKRDFMDCKWGTYDADEPRYEEATEDPCCARCPAGFTCGREKGHDGPHEAYFTNGLACARWRD